MAEANVKSEILKGSLVGAVINGVINGAINWFSVKGHSDILLTDNVINTTKETVFGSAVPLAVSLAFILTSIAFFTFKMQNKPKYFPRVFVQALRNSIFAFGLVVAFAILVQYYFGSMVVTPLHSAIIVGIVAAVVGGIVDYLTKVDLVSHPKV